MAEIRKPRGSKKQWRSAVGKTSSCFNDNFIYFLWVFMWPHPYDQWCSFIVFLSCLPFIVVLFLFLLILSRFSFAFLILSYFASNLKPTLAIKIIWWHLISDFLAALKLTIKTVVKVN
jgi:hypothetical protein